MLIAILTFVTLSVIGATIASLYSAAVQEERARLIEIVTSQARLIEAIARFDQVYSKNDIKGGSEQATLKQIREAHDSYRAFGETSEFTLARLDGEHINFLLRHRSDSEKTRENATPNFSMGGEYAVPMQQALSGHSGTIIAKDYRGVDVLAAYEPVAILNYGIVAKIDMAEIRAPFIRAGIFSLLLGLVMTAAGAIGFQRVTQPLINNMQRNEERMRLLLNSAGEGIYGIDQHGNCTFANPACLDLLGYDSDKQLLGRNMHRLIHHHHEDGRKYPAEDCPIFNSIKKVRGVNVDTEVYWRADGSSFPCEYHSHPIIENGLCTGAVISFNDISERRLSETQNRLATTVFENISEGIIVTDAKGRIIMTNRAFTDMTGYREDEVLGNNPSLLQSKKQSAEFYSRLWRTLEESGYWSGEIWNRRKDGEIYPQLETISSVKDDQGRVTNYVASFTDITALKETESRLEHLAHHDTLTGLPNRLLFNARYELSIQKAERHHYSLAILFIDLDGFKSINDIHGHEAGDGLLQEMAERMQSLLRHEDTVSRLGGDEFAILLTNIEDTGRVEMLAQKILDAICKPVTAVGKELSVSGSIGISIYPQDGTSMNDLLKKADKAMYIAKDRGKNQFAYAGEARLASKQ